MKNLLRSLAILYSPSFARLVVYMLQSTEYQIGPYLRWFWRTDDFTKVMHRRTLAVTRSAKLLLSFVQLGMLLQLVAAVGVFITGISQDNASMVLVGIALLLGIPGLWGHAVVLPLLLGRIFITKPSHRLQIKRSHKVFSSHKALKIAVAGSYGKTTMKEMLATVLAGGKKVAATPANLNVPISHARFAKKLKGDEEVLIIEYGESAPGDVKRFAKATKPDIGIITGLAPAHLDKYKTLKRAGEDIFSLSRFVKDDNTYVNEESEAVKPFLKPGFNLYGADKAAGWNVQNIKISLSGTSFEMKKDRQTFKLKSQLLGRHQVGPLALAAALAFKLGLNAKQIESGIAKIEPFEHRMELRHLGGANVVDDTYNGNIDGMKAGLELLKELPAKRKIYITPGLVDQGAESIRIHQELGKLIAGANPDIVVLMQHSVTPDIQKGLEAGNYQGRLILENDPLNFYNNLEQFVAAGDLVVMQNDWPDQYK
ncbi:MAG TPA: Mur ligase family protein [Candidatus Saccharimonadales bacterium]|nr:Mur ligase family protein [Candidatus Saccharimonadales bacterium]